jgi:hypothetical protein
MAEYREQEVIHRDGRHQPDQAPERAGRDRPRRAAEHEGDAEPDADQVDGEEQAERVAELIRQPRGTADDGAGDDRCAEPADRSAGEGRSQDMLRRVGRSR